MKSHAVALDRNKVAASLDCRVGGCPEGMSDVLTANLDIGDRATAECDQ
jgi:hypothetical protein